MICFFFSTQTFFQVWNRYGLKQPVKIILVETKQIIPDKNLFGQSNLAANAFNVVIQLATAPARVRSTSRRDRRSRVKSKSIANINKVANINIAQDHACADNAVQIASPSSDDIENMIEHVASMSELNSKSIGDICIPKTTNGEDDDGESEHENEIATTRGDITPYNYNTPGGEVVGPGNINDHNILDTSALAIALATRTRKGTNTMREGRNAYTE